MLGTTVAACAICDWIRAYRLKLVSALERQALVQLEIQHRTKCHEV